MSTPVPAGVITALVTPFHSDGSLNKDAIAELVDFQLRSEVAAVAVTAGAGEYVGLTPAERVDVIRQAAIAAGESVPVLAGILEPTTGAAVEASLAAREAGARAILLLTPFYMSPSAAGLVDHFLQVAEAVDLPIVLYNNPGRTGINLDLPTLRHIVQISQVVAIKECDRDLGRVAQKIMHLGDQLDFLGGDDDLCLPIRSVGAVGSIMSGANLFAPDAVSCYKATQNGNWKEALAIFQTRLLPFIALYRGPDHPGPLKEALGLAGFAVGKGRPPLQPIDEERQAQMACILRDLNLVQA